MAMRDECTDAGRMGAPSKGLAAYPGGDIDLSPRSLAEEKRMDPMAPGSAGDLAGLTDDILRREYNADLDPPLWGGRG